MKKTMLALSFFSLLFSNSKEQTNANAQTLLWKISGNGLQNESYILFTTSNTCEENIILSNKLKTALGKVKQVALESGVTNKNNNAELLKLIQVQNDSVSARNTLTPDTYEKLKVRAEQSGINEMVLNSLCMSYVNSQLVSMIAVCNLEHKERMDDALRNYADKNNLHTVDLLSPQETFATFYKYPKSFWEKIISYTLSNADKIKSLIDNKTQFYKQENFTALKQITVQNEINKTVQSYIEIESQRANLLYSRVIENIENKPSLICLDISDVANENASIFNMLSKAGYIITPVFK